MIDCIFPGARWLRCDLHVHTPFDRTKRYSEDVEKALRYADLGNSEPIKSMARRFFDACRNAQLDLVAITDHNTVEGFRRFAPILDEWRAETGSDLEILPGVEITVGGERNLHVLLICQRDADPMWIEEYLSALFEARPRLDDRGRPHSCQRTLLDFCRFTRDRFEERNYHYLLIPAHINRRGGIDSELRSAAPSTWEEELRNVLRERAFEQRLWAGFQVCGEPSGIPSLQSLLRAWAAAFFWGKSYQQLTSEEKRAVDSRRVWPVIEASDPNCAGEIGSCCTWLKMEAPDLEGIRLALLDPESRLRRKADGPPGQHYPRIERLRIRRTDFFEEIEIPFSPCLTTLIGGRGAGKSTVVEYLRYALGREREEDFSSATSDEMQKTRSEVMEILKEKSVRDFGQTKGTLLPDFELEADIVVSEHRYRVRRTRAGIQIVTDPGETSEEKRPLDVRTLIVPRVFSQGQIAAIAKDPRSQRAELDALIERERLSENQQARREVVERIQQLQTKRSRLRERQKTLPARETELRMVNDQIAFLEQEGRQDILTRFESFERERHWLDAVFNQIETQVAFLEQQAVDTENMAKGLPQIPADTPSFSWLGEVSARVRERLDQAAQALRTQAAAFRQLVEMIKTERATEWQANYDLARQEYEVLRQQMQERGVDFSHHEKLLQRRADLENEVATLRSTAQEIEQVEQEICEARSELVQLHEKRLALRREQARVLEDLDTDVRLEVIPFGDRVDFESRREEWFGGAGLQERDWTLLVDYVFATNGGVPERIAALVKALRIDIEATEQQGRPLDATESSVAKLLGSDAGSRLTGYFFRALERRERIRLDELEYFLPEDAVEARVRGPEGEFKPLITGSVGQRSTAILSLLLSAGKEPLIIDQPEADLDNRYIYEVVVNLLRQQKFSRQIIVATHNANIPVNGDAELIVALGVEDRMGKLLGVGSIDQAEIKDLVTVIMEGSAEAFRLRRERYGF